MLLKKVKVHGLAHITGGGITDNLPRIVPKGLCASINLKSLKIPRIFRYVQEQSKISDEEMLKTFNCGIGMVAIIDKNNLTLAHKLMKNYKYSYKVIGHIIKDPYKSKLIYVD